MNRVEFIGKLNALYVGDKNCLEELLTTYDEQNKEIERLNNIIEEYKNANEYHQNIIHELETMKQPNQLHSENVKLRAENNRLNNIIDKAREYIQDRYDGEVLTHTFDKDNVKELLEILEGENDDKENN